MEARPSATLWLALAGTGLAVLTAAGPALHHRLGGWALIALFAVGGLAAYGAARLGDRAEQHSALLVILATSAAGAEPVKRTLCVYDPSGESGDGSHPRRR